MKDRSHLIKSFERAGLELRLLKEPFGIGANDVFGMDILRKTKGNTRNEIFRIYAGHDDNLIEVTNIDKRLGQLVLAVKEAPRTFDEAVPESTILHHQKRHGFKDWFEKMLAEHRVTEKDVVKRSKNDKTIVLRRKTPGTKRHFLLGLDERQMFIAQLPRGVSTVREAHNSLRSSRVTFAEGKAAGLTVRQGEWFFVNITEDEKRALNEAVRKKLVLRKVNIGEYAGRRGGNPHTADELLRIPGAKLEHGFPIRQREEIYVRGKVRHVDHKTVAFKHWRRVIANRENSSDGRMAGIGWID